MSLDSSAAAGASQFSAHPARPKALTVAPENIPDELKRFSQWVVWGYAFDMGRQQWTKLPYQANGSGKASSTDPRTWSSFDDALKRYQAGGMDGIGFVVTRESGIIGTDLDHCFDRDTHTGEQWAVEIIQQFQSYTEFSPSREGIRTFIKGSLPGGIDGRKKGNIEIYSAGRYLTVTGHRLKNAPATIESRQDQINQLFREIFTEQPKPKTNGNGAGNYYHSVEDDELLKKAFAARNGDKLKRLFDGDHGSYPSQSEADMALCSMLAFWAQDEAQLDRLFRRSALFREKWDEKHGARTYGGATIEKAFAT
jgi:putative DNA primase/helicase